MLGSSYSSNGSRFCDTYSLVLFKMNEHNQDPRQWRSSSSSLMRFVRFESGHERPKPGTSGSSRNTSTTTAATTTCATKPAASAATLPATATAASAATTRML